MSNDNQNTEKVEYEVDDQVSGQLSTLNKGFLGKPQFWVVLAILAVIGFLLYRRKQQKKEQAEIDPEAQKNLNQTSAYPTQEEQQIQPIKADDERIVDETTAAAEAEAEAAAEAPAAKE